MKSTIFVLGAIGLLSSTLAIAAKISDDKIVTMVKGQPATAADVNNNFSALKNAINAKYDEGGNLIPNPNFENALNGWEAVKTAGMSTGDLVRAEATGGVSGQYAIQNPAGAVIWGSSTQWISLDQNSAKSFYVAGSFKRTTNAGTGSVYLTVRLRDADGNEIGGDGTWWYYPASNVVPPFNQWTHYRAEFGAHTARPFPANAKYATVGFILNYGTGTNHTYLVQGLSIAENPTASYVCTGDMIAFGNGCISPLQPTDAAPSASDFYTAQANCTTKYKGSVCMYHELMRACASGVIAGVGRLGVSNVWMGDHGQVPTTGNTDDEFLVTNVANCDVNMDGSPMDSTALNYYRCCR